jgi:hypothetical protein
MTNKIENPNAEIILTFDIHLTFFSFVNANLKPN